MSRRTERVGELLRRELASILINGEVRDDRLAHSAAISITAVHVSGDLSVARVFVDVLGEEGNPRSVVAALAGAAGLGPALVTRMPSNNLVVAFAKA